MQTDTVAGAEVTTLRIDLSGAMDLGLPASDSAVAVQWAVDGDRVLIGVGDRFVGRVLQLDQADSLAASDRFTAATGRYPGQNASTMFLDVAGLDGVLGSTIGADAGQGFADVDTVLSAFDYVLVDGRVEGGVVADRVAVVLK